MGSRRTFYWAVVLLVLLLVVALLAVPTPGTSDVKNLVRWMRITDTHGPIEGFRVINKDYPPLTSAVLWVVQQAAELVELGRRPALKLAIIGLLMTTCGVYWLCSRRSLGTARALLWSAFLGWGFLLNRAALGYVDVLFAPFLLGALCSMREVKPVPAALCFCIACLCKWQPLILAPFFAVLLLSWWRNGAQAEALRFAGVSLLTLGFFLLAYDSALFDALRRALSHKHLGGQGTNVGWRMTAALRVFAPDQYGPLEDGVVNYIFTTDWKVKLLPRLGFFAFYSWALVRAWRAQVDFGAWLRAALLGYLAYFIWNVGVHENHLCPALLLAGVGVAISAATPREFWAIAIALNLNQLLFYGFKGARATTERVIGSVDSTILVAFACVVGFCWWAFREFRRGGPLALPTEDQPTAGSS